MDKLEIKASLSIDDTGTITGIAWPFGSADSAGDIITKGAFNFAVSNMPMLFAHNPDDLIGTWDSLTETKDGLIAKGKLHMDQPRARAVHGLIKGGLVSGLSIGFRAKTVKQQGRNRVISALDLFEVSIVRNPAHPHARVTSSKSSALAIAEAIRATAALFSKGH